MATEKHILLINRDAQFGDQLAEALQSSGHAVKRATDMRSALSELAANSVGLIICDIELEDISGFDFLRFIKKDPLRENIPLMFLVPLDNQGRPFEALKLGAVDYAVYPMEITMLVERIGEHLEPASPVSEKTPAASKKLAETVVQQPVQRPPAPSQPAASQQVASQPAASPTPMPPVPMEVSRDGVIWMPSRLINFTDKSIQMKTALFGKKGVSLIIRFKRPEGTFVVYGRINEITVDDFQKPAEIDATLEESDAWRNIFGWLTQIRNTAEASGASTNQTSTSEPIAETIALPQVAGESSCISAEELFQKAERKKSSYDIRFYNSIIGKQLDNYKVISLVATGSMGGVLQGWDVALEREVALKIISFELSAKEQFRDMFIKEARVVSRLNHINIAQIYNIGLSNDILYYAMEYIEGVTLKDMVKKDKKLDILKGLSILTTVCNALDFVYQHGIVHRDIKPANIMVNKAGEVKIVDFGVAHNKGTKDSGKNKLMGTPLYMSPEQIVGLTLDHRSDMYSLGASFYHAFCGSPPFAAKAVNEILDQHLNATITPLSERNKKIPAELSKIIEKMMAKDPNHRYQSFKKAAEELHKLRAQRVPAERRGILRR